jgi:hypothetical protein
MTTAPRTRSQAALSHQHASASRHASRIIERVVGLATAPELLVRSRRTSDAQALRRAFRNHDTETLFDALICNFAFQGISNRVASDYLDRHGQLRYRDLAADLGRNPTCPKLQSYWSFHRCGYHKTDHTCSDPIHIDRCPLPGYPQRNGRLNQTGYALVLFTRDIAGGDLAGWIKGQIGRTGPITADRLARDRAALLQPLRNLYGVADKILSMVLSDLLMTVGPVGGRLFQVGASMIVVDTLVHNFLHRTGVLKRSRAEHAFGAGCYQPGGCADIIRAAAETIDARPYGAGFPRSFPRLVQHAIWRYCAEEAVNICNGNRIADRDRCQNWQCQLRPHCARIALGDIK